MTHAPHLSTKNVHIDTPLGRALFHELNLILNRGDRVAVVGRNGTGKSTLLRVLYGDVLPSRGRVQCTGSRGFVPQLDEAAADASPGERRRAALEHAFAAEPDFLLLDEPSLDLDFASVAWLLGALERHAGACVVVSHDRRVLRHFNDFFVVSEAGCHHQHGSFDTLLAALANKQDQSERNYLQQLHHHLDDEAAHVRLARSRERKKILGRVRELKRCPARARLNGKRSYAQVSQTRRSLLQDKRIEAAREWVKAARRSMDVQLPLEATFAELPDPTPEPIIDAVGLTLALPCGASTPAIDLSLTRERVGVFGPNGSGKTTLLEGLIGARPTLQGEARTALHKVGYVAQNASNWQKQTCLLEELCFGADDLHRAATAVAAHRFPIALAERPLVSLSPGERLRASLLALCERRPAVELLVLDEPTNHLDLLATNELERVLRAWPGGLLVVSHDVEFLRNIGVERVLCHANDGWVSSYLELIEPECRKMHNPTKPGRTVTERQACPNPSAAPVRTLMHR